jgi:hypothetical protein
VWDGKRQCWHVTPDAPEMLRAGAIASFPTLLEAEQFVIERADVPQDCDPGMLGAS